METKCARGTAEPLFLPPMAECAAVGSQIECLPPQNDPLLLQAFNFQMARVFRSHAARKKTGLPLRPGTKVMTKFCSEALKHTRMGRMQDSRFSWPLYLL